MNNLVGFIIEFADAGANGPVNHMHVSKLIDDGRVIEVTHVRGQHYPAAANTRLDARSGSARDDVNRADTRIDFWVGKRGLQNAITRRSAGAENGDGDREEGSRQVRFIQGAHSGQIAGKSCIAYGWDHGGTVKPYSKASIPFIPANSQSHSLLLRKLKLVAASR